MVRAGQEFSASIIERSVVGNVRVVNGRRAADSGSGCQYWTLGTGNALAIDRLDEWVPEARTLSIIKTNEKEIDLRCLLFVSY